MWVVLLGTVSLQWVLWVLLRSTRRTWEVVIGVLTWHPITILTPHTPNLSMDRAPIGSIWGHSYWGSNLWLVSAYWASKGPRSCPIEANWSDTSDQRTIWSAAEWQPPPDKPPLLRCASAHQSGLFCRKSGGGCGCMGGETHLIDKGGLEPPFSAHLASLSVRVTLVGRSQSLLHTNSTHRDPIKLSHTIHT